MDSLDSLEYFKVLELVSDFALTTDAKKLILDERPSSDYNTIVKKLDELELTTNLFLAFGPLDFTLFNGIDGIVSLVAKNGILTTGEFLEVLKLIKAKDDVVTYLKLAMQKIDVSLFLNNFKYEPFNQIRSQITSKIKEDGSLYPNASLKLERLTSKKQSTEDLIKQKLHSILQRDKHLLQDNLITIRDNHYTLPYKIENKNKIDGIVRDISNTNTTCYIEPRVILHDTETLLSLINDIKIEEREILKKLTLFLNQYLLNITSLKDEIIALDSLFAKAKFLGKDTRRPRITLIDKTIHLKNLYHPLLPRTSAVPLNLHKKQDINGYVITGPNAGGKTVTLKTIGLWQALVQTGYFVISRDLSTFPLFDHILVSIGDEQSLEASLSTFSAHITKLKSFLTYDLSNSLVIIDELASGTNPDEGEALAKAFIDYLCKNAASFFITTHYNNLKNYVYTNPKTLNASMLFQTKTNKPTFILQEGVPGLSYALEICSNLALEAEIIESARDYLSANKNALSSVLEQEIAKFKAENLNLLAEKEELDLKVKVLDQKLKTFARDQETLINEAKMKANAIIQSTQRESAEILASLHNAGLDLKTKQALTLELKKLKEEELENSDTLALGDHVYIIPYQTNGVITAIKKDLYTVDFASFQLKFKKSDLKKTEVEAKQEMVKQERVSVDRVSKTYEPLDLRGVRYLEVEQLLNSYLDQALLAKLEEVTIIHGFGTGVVRKRVHELLKKNKHVTSFRLGGEGEGLHGVTICKLK